MESLEEGVDGYGVTGDGDCPSISYLSNVEGILGCGLADDP